MSDKIDKLLESIVEKILKMFDKFLDKVDKKLDDEDFVESLSKYVKVEKEENK